MSISARSRRQRQSDGADRTGHGAPPARCHPSAGPRSARSRSDGASPSGTAKMRYHPPRFAVFLNSLRKAVYSPIQRRKNFVAFPLSITTSLLCGLPVASVPVSEAMLCPRLSLQHHFECNFFFPLAQSRLVEKNKAFFQCPA